MSGLWTVSSAAAVGVPWLERAIAPATEFGRRYNAQHAPYRPGDESLALAAIVRIQAVAQRISADTLDALHAKISRTPDPAEAVARARADEPLNDAELFDLTGFLDIVAEVRALGEAIVMPEIELPPLPVELREVLATGRTAAGTFYLDDRFDPALAAARADAAGARAAYDVLRSRLLERIGRYANVERVHDGGFILMREQMHGPLPPEVRVVREAATYLLCEVALDEAALEALRACEDADRRVVEIEERLRIGLGGAVRAAQRELEGGIAALGALDAFLARVRFAQRYETVVPEIVDVPEIAFVEGRYLPLAAALSEHDRTYLPISLALQGIGVITGPNMGGKTAALRTCGFLGACLSFGLPVPAQSARLALFDEIAWLGSEAARHDESLLSSFGSEVVALREFFERGARAPLVLIDEFARTTTPHEARALLIGLLESLRERNACALAATHLGAIAGALDAAHYAIVGLQKLQPLDEHRALRLDEALTRISAAMDYRIRRVDGETVPQADAMALAAALGLDAELLARARRHL
ncbi:MAG TPA: hypothetical protein VME66_04285 [Candidatus Acidoferrales bacterium]|nr:hypothetical protein [Candidatus Acidoferrales bacterium]